jgi:hypothetical protein
LCGLERNDTLPRALTVRLCCSDPRPRQRELGGVRLGGRSRCGTLHLGNGQRSRQARNFSFYSFCARSHCCSALSSGVGPGSRGIAYRHELVLALPGCSGCARGGAGLQQNCTLRCRQRGLCCGTPVVRGAGPCTRRIDFGAEPRFGQRTGVRAGLRAGQCRGSRTFTATQAL